MKKRYLHIFSAFAIAAFVLAACSGSGAQVEAKPPLRVAWTLWPGYYPLLIADQKGFFEKHDVNVQLVHYSTTGEETVAVASGMVDGGTIALNDALLDAVAKNVKVILITDNSDGGDQIVAAQDITSAQDIAQKNIGAKRGSLGEFIVREMLRQKGIPPSDVTFINVDPENVSSAMPAYISLGHTYEPFTAQALAKGYKVIFSSAEMPGLIVNSIAFRRSAIEERPEDIKAFVAAWFEAVQYWQDHPEESNELIAKATGQEVEDVSLEGVKLFNLSANQNAFKPGTDTSSVYYTARTVSKFLLDSGFVVEPVEVNDVLDDSFLR